MSTLSNSGVTTPRRSATPDQDGALDPRRWRLLPVVLSAMFMAMFDFFVVNVAAPSLQHDLRASDAMLEFVVGGYAFTYASGMVLGGRLGDLFGYRRLFLLGMSAFTVASLLCGLAQSAPELVVARLLQGLTAAAMVPQVLALITASFPTQERGRALAWFGAVTGLGSVAGQVIGGLLLNANVFGWGWRTIFMINVPIGVGAVAFALRLLPSSRARTRPRLDIVGAVGVSGGLALALIPLVMGQSTGWPEWTWICLIASVPVLLGTLGYERRLGRRNGAPLLDLALLRVRGYVAGLAVIVVFMSFFGSFMFAVTLVLQSGLGMSPLAAGLAFGPLGLAFAAMSMLARGAAVTHGRRVITIGTLVSSLGLAALLVATTLEGGRLTVYDLLPGLLLIGIGNGLALPTVIGTALSGVNPRRAGAAAGMFTTTQQFASAAGVAVIGAIFFTLVGAHPDRAGYVSAMGVVAGLNLLLTLAGTGFAQLLPKPARFHPRHAAAGTLPTRRLAIEHAESRDRDWEDAAA